MTALTKATAASGWSRTLQVVEQNFVAPLHIGIGGPHFRVVRPLFGQLVASRLKYFRIRIVRRPFRTFLAIPDDTGAVAHVLTVSAFRARLGSAATCFGAREEVREIG